MGEHNRSASPVIKYSLQMCCCVLNHYGYIVMAAEVAVAARGEVKSETEKDVDVRISRSGWAQTDRRQK